MNIQPDDSIIKLDTLIRRNRMHTLCLCTAPLSRNGLKTAFKCCCFFNLLFGYFNSLENYAQNGMNWRYRNASTATALPQQTAMTQHVEGRTTHVCRFVWVNSKLSHIFLNLSKTHIVGINYEWSSQFCINFVPPLYL